MSIDSRWAVPDEYEYENLDPSRPLIENRRSNDWPAVHLLAMRQIELQLAESGASPLHLAAWQLASSASARAVQTVDAFLRSTPAPSAEDRLSFAHVISVASHTDGTQSHDVYLPLWESDEIPPRHPRRVELGVSLAADVLAFSVEKAIDVLEGVRPLLERATRVEAAMFELVFAMAKLQTDPDAAGEAIERAHDQCIVARDPVGMAQCALAQYRHEQATSGQGDAMLDYLSYAVHQYEVSCRYAWAASTLWFAVVPLLADRLSASSEVIAAVLGRAADYADRGRSHREWAAVRQLAARVGLFARDLDGTWAFEPRPT